MDAADQIKALGDLEYESDMSEYLDPIARYGFDVDIWRSTKRGSHFDPFKDTINIQPTHTGSKGVQAHEYRHRAFNKMFREYRKNPEFYEEKYPGVGDLLKSMIIRKDDEDLNERITEFYDKPEMFNLSPQYFTPDRVLHKGRHYKEDPYEYSNVEHDGMPVYGTAFDVRRYLPKGSVEDTLDFGDEAGLKKRREFNEYRDQTDGNRDGNVFFDNVLRLEQMAKDLYKEERGFAQGGPVMNGIGTLNETARNMFRGPRGVGAYQQFASGGEAMGPPPTRGPDPQGIGYFQQFADGGPVYMSNGGESKDTRSEYRRALALRESGDKLDAFNEDENAMGLYQAIPLTLKDFKKQNDLSFSNEAFLNSKPLQESFQDWFEGKTLKYIKQYDLDKFVGKVVGGVPVTKSAMLAMAHLGGDFGMRQFLETNGTYNPGDANKTRLRDYGIQMSGLDIGEGPQDKVFSQEEITSVALQSPPEAGPVRPRLRPEFLGDKGVTTSLRPQLRPQGIMSIQDPAVIDRVVEQVQEDLPAQQEERRLYEKYSPENMFSDPDAGLTEGEMIRRERFAPKDGDAEPYQQPPSTLEQIDEFFQRFAPSRKPERVIQPKYTPMQYRDA